MRLTVEVVGVEPYLAGDAETTDLIEACLAYAVQQFDSDHSKTASIAIKITSEVEIADLHRIYFEDPTVTDVITFPGGEEFENDGEGHLGDIAICYPVAVEQAWEQQHSVRRELVFLSLHGLLHLLEFDDQSEVEREAMMRIQEQLIASYESYSGQTLS